MFVQDTLKYDFNALEPHIDTLTMETHYGKHHAAYTNNLNKALDKLPELADKGIEEILKDLNSITDTALRTTVRNNGGGYYITTCTLLFYPQWWRRAKWIFS